MYRRKKKLVRIPKLKQSKTQGKIAYDFLEIIDKEPFRNVSQVRKEFKPIVFQDKAGRARNSKRLLKSFEKQMSTSKGKEKLFDSEYCRLRDFLEAFDFIATLGPHRKEMITLTYFGSKLLNSCKQNNVRNIFDDSNRQFLGRVYLFIDNQKSWNFIQIIRKKGPIRFKDFQSLLIQLGIGFEIEKIKKDIVAKPDFKKWLMNEWRKEHKLAPMDYNWKKKKTEEATKELVKAREEAYVRALINLYADVELVKKRKDILYCDIPYVEELYKRKFWATSEDIAPEYFFVEAYNTYLEQMKNKRIISLEIPKLRRAVCLKLNTLWHSFDRILRRYPMGYGDYEVILTRASGKRKLDLRINSQNFYYISIRKKPGVNKNVRKVWLI